MIRHVVLFNVRPTAGAEEVAAVVRAARELPDRIPGVRNLAVSAAFEAVQPPRFSHALTMEFADETALRAYLDHPVHQRFREVFYPVRDDFLIATLREIGGPD